eukprot:4343018-Prymnesium_polylepis.1
MRGVARQERSSRARRAAVDLGLVSEGTVVVVHKIRNELHPAAARTKAVARTAVAARVGVEQKPRLPPPVLVPRGRGARARDAAAEDDRWAVHVRIGPPLRR